MDATHKPLAEFARLHPSLQAALLHWIDVVFAPAKSVFRSSTYGIKHWFESQGGLYISSEACAGGFIAVGNEIAAIHPSAPNYYFRVRPRFQFNHMPVSKRYETIRESIDHGTDEERALFAALVADAKTGVERAA